MIRNETFLDGVCIYADCYDLTTRTYQREEMGVIVATRPMTTEEWLTYGPQPLDKFGAMAALNVVLGIWDMENATNFAGVSEQDLINEVEGWAAAYGGLV